MLTTASGAAQSASTIDFSEANVKAELLSEMQTVQAGTTVWVFLKQTIREGWHTYWRNPGDSGAPTKLLWDLPPGFEAGEIQWPYPERTPYGPLMNYGYEGEVLFPVQIKIPEGFKGSEVLLKAKGQWLVCADICIPEDADLALTIPIGPSTIDPALVDEIEAVRRKVPQPLGVPTRFRVNATGDDGVGTVTIEIDMPALVPERIKSISYFPYIEGVIENPAEQVVHVDNKGIQLTLVTGWDFGPQSTFEGIIVVTEDAGEELVNAFSFDPVKVGTNGANLAKASKTASDTNLLTAILFALIGGMILNLMPCVFPVLSIKVLSLVRAERCGSWTRSFAWVGVYHRRSVELSRYRSNLDFASYRRRADRLGIPATVADCDLAADLSVFSHRAKSFRLF